ncbi:hypothetical protein AWC38_SpisGene22820 [Stylophora pistillata]|uniref:Reverse transcriptase domain-containing protein n=1 Tax=Stylophora pistillata TaxID=50429 RepID=A0A2B4RA13_STYPI|nr:hypothetical protein AWC38_SpisGene22820 [Stylophora pistillata]
MLEQGQELEKKAERLRLEEQLAVAQVRERVFAEIENGAKEDLSHQPAGNASEALRVPEFSQPGKNCLNRKNCASHVIIRDTDPTDAHKVEPVGGAHDVILRDFTMTSFALMKWPLSSRYPSPTQLKDHFLNAQAEMDEATCNATGTEKSVSAVPIVPVRLRSAESEVVTYAMLDACSTSSFILQDIVPSLGVKGTDTQLMVKTINGTKLHDAQVLNGIAVTDLKGDNTVQLPKIFTKNDLSTSENVLTPALAHRWKHFKGIEAELPPQLPDAKIGLLIGSNCPKALEPIEVLASEDGGPFAIKTFAGWAIVGPLYMCSERHPTVDCHRVAAVEVCSDKKFLKIVTQGTRRTGNSHYEIPLPFRCDDVRFPENKEQVLQRAHWLRKKLINNEKLYKDYVNFMNSIIAKGFAWKVPSDRLFAKTGQVWYIPHHGVYHARKPNKIRVVFECSARFGGTSLNDELLQGPDLTNQLVGVLTRFRQGPVAFMSDIDAMFHQVRVPEGQRDFLRFLWWPDGDLMKNLEEYQMNVHLFGAVSSPSCSNFALRRAADGAEKIVGPETADVLRKNFYVDDCLRTEETSESAIQRVRGVRHARAHGGFNLAKFVSNSRLVLESVPDEALAQDIRTLELGSGELPLERALGVQWATDSDTSTGYGQVTYLRIKNEKGDIHRTFLMGKARIAPVKIMTITRLELTAVTVSVKEGEMIAREIDEPPESKTYWTDSTTVLKYIRNDKKRFHVFVANRVQTIRDAMNPNQWRYVGTDINPADDLSRGLKGHELSKQHRWITGPNFLWQPESEWPRLHSDLDDVSNNDPEVMKVLVHSMKVEETAALLQRFARFSEWHRMKKCIAWILRLKPNSDERALLPKDRQDKVGRTAKVKRKPLRVEELDRAEKTILKLVQSSTFPKEIEALQKVLPVDCESDRQFAKEMKSEIKKSSTLYHLDPFLDQDGLVRVGGRLSKSQELSEG